MGDVVEDCGKVACCAAVPGFTSPGYLRSANRNWNARPGSGSAPTAVSGWPGRSRGSASLPHASLPIYPKVGPPQISDSGRSNRKLVLMRTGWRSAAMENMATQAIRAMAVTAFLMIFAFPALADYEAGKAAWKAGKVAEAVAAVARGRGRSGDRRAMLELGRLYVQGLGVPQSYVQAHVWFNLAASRGEVEALKERDAVAAKMTPQQLASAQERALSWRPGGDGEAGAGSSEHGHAAGQGEAGSGAAAGPPPRRAIVEAQGLLAELGYKPGPVDGQWGSRSARAYAAFLGDAGMPQTGGSDAGGFAGNAFAGGQSGEGRGRGFGACDGRQSRNRRDCRRMRCTVR